MAKKITLATVKSFIKNNSGNLFININSSFDGMYDCCVGRDGGFVQATADTKDTDYTLGISGAWFVGGSRDYFNPFDEDGFTGIKVYNSCGSFILAIKK